jgi:HlyD family secretion protein
VEYLNLEEGDVRAKKQVALIDTTQLYLNKQQLIASINTVDSKSRNVLSQINVSQEQLKTTREIRSSKHVCRKCGHKRQLDDEIDGKVNYKRTDKSKNPKCLSQMKPNN